MWISTNLVIQFDIIEKLKVYIIMNQKILSLV